MRVLAAADMDGRASGTPGGDRAAATIARWLGDAGLRPGGDGGTFLQSFAVSTSPALADGNSLEIFGNTRTRFALERDWMPHGGSLSGEITADIVAVGHGIVTADGRHDDYAGVDARGKIAIAEEGVPAGVAAGEGARIEKLIAARHHGVRALLIVADRLPTVVSTATPVHIVSAAITPDVAKTLLAGRPGQRATIRVALGTEEHRAANVIGVIPGHDPDLAREAVVVGAHYDHLGRVDGRIHPGADDNASGTAVAVELARTLAAAGGAPRTLVFALFAGEELGLLGSRHYVGHPTVPIERTAAMVNLDMVGRMRDDRLIVFGVDSGSGLRQIVERAARTAGVHVDLRGEPQAASDHVRFYRSGTPVVFFHTGTHDDYHRPSDTADRIDASGMARVGAVALRVVEDLATGPRAMYATVPEAARPSRGAGAPHEAFLGIMSDGDGGDGVRLTGILPESAAARAGLREDDVIVRFAGTPVVRFDDLRRGLRQRKPGDTVDVVVLREGEDRTLSTALGARP